MAESIRIDESPESNRRRANWTQLVHKVYEVDPLNCTRCSSIMRIIALIDVSMAVGVIARPFIPRIPDALVRLAAKLRVPVRLQATALLVC